MALASERRNISAWLAKGAPPDAPCGGKAKRDKCLARTLRGAAGRDELKRSNISFSIIQRGKRAVDATANIISIIKKSEINRSHIYAHAR